ncbi:MAG: SufS family cysteine desulfurase [Candidatus Anstonellales archaeon]
MVLLDSAQIKKDFPLLTKKINGKPLVYLDNAATTQKPKEVISKLNEYYSSYNANIHRGIYSISEKATEEYEKARFKVAQMLNADTEEIIFTKNATESLNIASRLSLQLIKSKRVRVLLTKMEHHSSIVPWHLLKLEGKNILFDWVNINIDGALDLNHYSELIAKNPSIVSFTQASNVLGTINPAKQMVKMAKEVGAVTIIDAAQSAPHIKINVRDIDPDFLAFSAHKMLGPTGLGILYIKKEHLDFLKPVFGGGGAINEVRLSFTQFASPPAKFEAGTPPIGEAISFGVAVEYLKKIGMDRVHKHELELVKYAIKRLEEINNVHLYGSKLHHRVGVIPFNVEGIHPHDLATFLNDQNICIRAGHHCAMPLHESLGLTSTARISFYLYNTKSDVTALIDGLEKAKEVFK